VTVTTWRYYLPNDEMLEGWAIVFLDSIGCFSTVSDWGNYGYRWDSPGSTGGTDFRQWLIERGDDYLLSKLCPGRRNPNHKQAVMFLKRAMPRLRQAIREELKAETERAMFAARVGGAP
jgi:hypothetical protein